MSLIVSDSLKGLIDEESLNNSASSLLLLTLLVNDKNSFLLKNITFENQLLTMEVFGDILDISKFIEFRNIDVNLKLIAANKKIDIAHGQLIINSIHFKKEDNSYTVKSSVHLGKEKNNDQN
jgi:hypothetical protein